MSASRQPSKTGSKTGKNPSASKLRGKKRAGSKPKSSQTGPSGRRAGTKRSDRRWVAEDGTVWASKFEYIVYDALCKHYAGTDIRVERCGEDCSFGYHSSVKNGLCALCGGHDVVQTRVYTPDIRIVRASKSGGQSYTYIEAKGYFEGSKRNLFRQVLQQHKGADIRIIAERNHPVTKGKTNLTDWAKRFKIRLYLWDKGSLLDKEWL